MCIVQINLPFGLSVVVEASVVVVVVGRSVSHRLSPLMQAWQDSSMVEQFLKRKQGDAGSQKVNQRHPRVDWQSFKHSSFVSVSWKKSTVPLHSPWIQHCGSCGEQSRTPLRQSLQIVESRLLQSWRSSQKVSWGEKVNHWQEGSSLQSCRHSYSSVAKWPLTCSLLRHSPCWKQSSLIETMLAKDKPEKTQLIRWNFILVDI